MTVAEAQMRFGSHKIPKAMRQWKIVMPFRYWYWFVLQIRVGEDTT